MYKVCVCVYLQEVFLIFRVVHLSAEHMFWDIVLALRGTQSLTYASWKGEVQVTLGQGKNRTKKDLRENLFWLYYHEQQEGEGDGVCVQLIAEFHDNFSEKASLDNTWCKIKKIWCKEFH